MRTRASRAGIGAAALAAALVLFFVLGRDRNPGPDATAQAGSAPGAAESLSDSRTTTEPESVPGESQSRSAPPQTPAKGRILYGSPVGGVRRLEYEKGERVRFSVRSDTADEVHVHGFDITKELPANRTVQFEFPADFEGVFDVELHHGNVEIAELRVRP